MILEAVKQPKYNRMGINFDIVPSMFVQAIVLSVGKGECKIVI